MIAWVVENWLALLMGAIFVAVPFDCARAFNATYRGDELLSDREPDGFRSEVESVPVHADGMTHNGERNHVG